LPFEYIVITTRKNRLADQDQDQDSDKELEQFKIRIIATITNKSKKYKQHNHIVQGEPFSWGVTIKNIDIKPSPEAIITDGGIKDLDDKFFQYMTQKEIYIRSLNPDEEIFIEIDKGVIFLEGIQWCYLHIEPKDDDKCFITHQFDEHHNITSPLFIDDEDNNNWLEQIYIQKKMELLQSRTNQYILLLTMITVWESIFGIKDTLKNLSTILSGMFNWIACVVEWLGKLL
jgi:hypothetical protein